MRRPAVAIAWAATAMAQQPPPVVVFKKARTGSTWLADMLEKDDRVAFFRHEAQGCFSDGAEPRERAFEVMARRPTCSTQMCPSAKKDAWLTAPTTTDCFADKLVGFDVNPHAHALLVLGARLAPSLKEAGEDRGVHEDEPHQARYFLDPCRRVGGSL